MPIIKSAKKALRVSQRKNQVNQPYREKLRNLIKDLNQQPDKKKLPLVFSTLDRAAKKNIIHKKTADRLKARLTKKTKSSTPAKTPKSSTSSRGRSASG